MAIENLDDFSAGLAAEADAADDGVRLLVGKFALDTYRHLTLVSPVDTGHFRRNWNLTEGEPDYGVRDGGGGAPRGPGLAFVEGIDPYTVVHIANGVPYAEALELGSSKQAPAGMVIPLAQRLASEVAWITEVAG